MRIVVTGATGNAGTALLRRLQAQPEVTSIVGVARRRPNTEVAPYAGVEWMSVDVGAPESSARLVEAFTDADVVVHLAWRIQPSHDEPQMHRVNVDGTRRVATAAASARVSQLIVASSVGAYSQGSKDFAVGESWPTGGIHSSAYSRHKSAVERGLDATEAEHPQLVVTRVRPGLVFQQEAGSEIARYFLGGAVPTSLIGRIRLPVLPLPRQIIVQAIHADDLAAAYWVLIAGRHGGAYNVAADPVLTPTALATAIGAHGARHLPLAVLRTLAWCTWRAHVQPTDPGWIDLAANCPVMDSTKLRSLGWKPAISADQALADLIRGISGGFGAPTPPMRARRLLRNRRE